MESNHSALGLLLILLLIVGANLLMYAIVRGVARGQSGKTRWFSALKDTLSKPMDTPANRSLDELRKQVEELEKKKKSE